MNSILLIGLKSFLHGSRSLSRYLAPQFLQTLRGLWCVMRGPSPRIFRESHVACAPAVILFYPAVLLIMPSSSLSISLLSFISSCSAVVLHDTSSPRPRQGLFGVGNRISPRRWGTYVVSTTVQIIFILNLAHFDSLYLCPMPSQLSSLESLVRNDMAACGAPTEAFGIPDHTSYHELLEASSWYWPCLRYDRTAFCAGRGSSRRIPGRHGQAFNCLALNLEMKWLASH